MTDMTIRAATLFENDPSRGRARRTDPVTSVESARIPRGGVRADILTAFYQHGRMCDQQLCAVLDQHNPPSVITARSALKADGLVEHTGAFRVNRRGRRQMVWGLTELGRARARRITGQEPE